MKEQTKNPKIVKSEKQEPEIYVVFERDLVILVRTEGVVAIPLKQWEIAARAVRRHQKALALARSKTHTKALEDGYADWLTKHLDGSADPAPTFAK
jgi:hypothetical protein